MIDPKDLKSGDMVRLKPQKVIRNDTDGFFFTSTPSGIIMWTVDHIEEILPRPLAAGDRIRVKPRDHIFRQNGVILAIYGLEAWIKWDDQNTSVVLIEGNIERIPV